MLVFNQSFLNAQMLFSKQIINKWIQCEQPSLLFVGQRREYISGSNVGSPAQVTAGLYKKYKGRANVGNPRIRRAAKHGTLIFSTIVFGWVPDG